MTNPLTTAAPAPAGIYWQAAIFTEFGVSVAPEIGMSQVPERGFNVSISPQIGMQPPAGLTLYLSPYIGMDGGTRKDAGFGLVLAPYIGMGDVPDTAFTLSITPSIGMVGKGNPPRGRQVNVSVHRSSTF